MARLWTYGFEAGVLTSAAYNNTNATIGTTQCRTGAYGIRITHTGGYLRNTLGADITELYARTGFYVPSGTGTVEIMHFLNSENENMLKLLVDRDAGYILSAQRSDGASWTELAHSSKQLLPATWYCVEFHVKLHDSEGVAQVKVNGSSSLWINYSGDTLGSNTPASIRVFGIGYCVSGSGGADSWYDDLAINDTAGDRNNSWCGVGGVYPIRPTGAGDHTGQTPSTGNNWACVDEVPPSDTDYVYTDTVGVYDLYACSDPSPDPGTADVVTLSVFARAKLAAAGANDLATIIKTNDTEVQGSAVTLSTTAAYIATTYDLNPVTEEAWTLDEVKALQIGTIAK